MNAKFLSLLLTGTVLSSSTFAQITVNSYDAFIDELNKSTTADVVLNMNGQSLNTQGYTSPTVEKEQSVTFKNIDLWSGISNQTINYGTMAFDNVTFKNNNIRIVGGSGDGGGFVHSIEANITHIYNTVFDSNNITSSSSLWGGIIRNANSNIDVIKDSVFSNNIMYSESGAPHGGILYNGGDIGASIKLIDNVSFENNSMTSAKDNIGGAHGVAIDNNAYGVIEKITNSKFINNKTYRTGYEEKTGNYHASAGAIDNYHIIGEISNSLFMGNNANSESVSANASSGAIMNLFAHDNAIGHIKLISNSKFIENYAEHKNSSAYGGAITNGKTSTLPGFGRIDKIENVLFQGNYVKGGRDESKYIGAYGGAIANSAYIGSISGEFNQNYVMNTKGVSPVMGGAIVNSSEDAEITSINANFKNNYVQAATGKAEGGAIYNRLGAKIGDIVGDFKNNYATSLGDTVYGGAISNRSATSINLIQGNFEGNYAVSNNGANAGGAIYNNSTTIGKIKSNFSKNYVQSTEGSTAGGAINNNQNSKINQIEGTFDSNYAISTNKNASGGALINWGAIEKAEGSFINNYVQAQNARAVGGAIANQWGNANSLGINFLKGTFQNNYASALGNNGYAQGGAIYNKSGNSHAMLSINSSSFINNYVVGTLETTNGGAIYNDGTINFSGSNYFDGNYMVVNSNKIANDIYNAGNINMLSNSIVEIKSGIDGSDGSINMSENSRLNIYTSQVSGNNLVMNNNSTLAIEINNITTSSTEQLGGKIDGDITLNGTNNLYVETYVDSTSGIQTGEYKFANNVNISAGNWNLQQKENGLYNYTVSFTDNSNKNTLIFNYERKNEKEVADSLGVSQEDAKAIIEISKNKSKNPLFEDLRNNIDENAQNKNSNISTTLRDIKDNPVANLNMVKNIDDIVIKVVNHQIVAHQNAPLTKNIWLSGVYHSSEYKGNLDYKSDSHGFVGGFDRYLSENIIGGAGYSYIKTDGKSNNKKLDIDTHNMFVYGQYSKNNWFVDLYASYNTSTVNQNKKVLYHNLNGKYDIDMYSAQILGGKNIYFENNKFYLRPNGGLRYYYITQDSYRDNADMQYEKISEQIVSGVLGTELVYNTDTIFQRGYINASYNFINDDINMHVQLPNANGYYMKQNADQELGLEIGYGLETQINKNIKIGLNYEFDWQKDYNAHLTFVNMQYNF